ncbi:MAG: OmpA family protein [Rhodocyclaceae bacterium]|nr:OmpA family protein [Rhodocyclaceae bacterium]
MRSRYVSFSRFAAVLLLVASTGALFSLNAVAAEDDAAKLEALKRAMGEPAIGGEGKKKHRTRAIVFDGDAAEPSAAAAATDVPKAATVDCAALSPDVPANAVDFAIQFKVGSAEVSPASMATLTEIGKILSLSPERCVLVEGHTDATGNADKNMTLSRERADSVIKFVTEKGGLERKRFMPIGKGSSAPIKDADPRDPKNRRVVFKVVTG